MRLKCPSELWPVTSTHLDDVPSRILISQTRFSHLHPHEVRCCHLVTRKVVDIPDWMWPVEMIKS